MKYLSVRRVYTHSDEVFEAEDDEKLVQVEDLEGDMYIYLLRKRDKDELEVRF